MNYTHGVKKVKVVKWLKEFVRDTLWFGSSIRSPNEGFCSVRAKNSDDFQKCCLFMPMMIYTGTTDTIKKDI